MEIFWVTWTHLRVNGEKMTPEEAYKKYPEAKEIEEFVYCSEMKRKFEQIVGSEKQIFAGSLADKCVKIRNKIEEIFETLKIKKNSESVEEQIENAFKLFKYVIMNSKYDPEIMRKKEELPFDSMLVHETLEIYECLFKNRSVCSGDASTLSLLLRHAGIDSHHTTIGTKGKSPREADLVHEVVKMKIDDMTLYCDPTLVRTTLEKGIIPDINYSVFAFPPDRFFANLYPIAEEKWEHEPIQL